MKKICFFMGSIDLSGGTERVAISIANNLVNMGYNVSILALKGSCNSHFKIDPKINIKSLSMKKISFSHYIKIIFQIRKFILENKVDTFICVESILSLYLIPRLVPSTKTICWEHFNFSVNLGRKLRNISRYYAALFFDQIITLTERDRQLWINQTKCLAKVDTINNPSTFQVSNTSPSLKNKKFLAVGRLVYQKGFDILLNSWAKSSAAAHGWTLSIVGDGEELIHLKALIAKLNLSSSVSLEGHSQNIANHYIHSSFYIMTSRFEGLPMVLLEAQSFGLPILSVDCPTGPSEIIKHGENGFLCKNNDISELITEVITNISENDYIKLVENSKYNIKNYDMKNIMEKWHHIL